MKLKFLILLLTSTLFLYNCNANNGMRSCKQLGEKANKLYIDYIFLKDTTFVRLDSALCLIDSIINDCDEYYVGLASTKLKILSLERKYARALKFINSLDSSKLVLLNKSILRYRFIAMQSQYNGDSIIKKKYLNKIIIELNDSINNHSKELNVLLQQRDILKILDNRFGYLIAQYYYYYSIINGKKEALLKLNTFQKRIKGNEEYFSWVNKIINGDNFLDYNGL